MAIEAQAPVLGEVFAEVGSDRVVRCAHAAASAAVEVDLGTGHVAQAAASQIPAATSQIPAAASQIQAAASQIQAAAS